MSKLFSKTTAGLFLVLAMISVTVAATEAVIFPSVGSMNGPDDEVIISEEVFPMGNYPEDVNNVQQAVDDNPGGGDKVIISEEVFPTGNYSEDVNNVQQAVDNNPGGTVVLKAGTFNFGDDTTNRGKVTIKTNVTILGDGRDVNGDPMTKIHGGFPAFETLPGSNLSLTVQDIWFDDAKFVAIRLRDITGNTNIIGNKITNMVDLPLSSSQFHFAGVAFGIRIEDGDGLLRIEDNFIDVDPQGRFPEFTIGIGINTRRLRAITSIAGNTTFNTSHAGILVLDNFEANTISHNIVDTGDVPGPSKSTFGAEGIVAVAQLFPTSDQGKAVIHENIIKTGAAINPDDAPDALGGPGPIALGIMLSGPHVATNNHVTMNNGYAAVLHWTNREDIGDIQDSYVANNIFAGDALYLWSAAGTRNQPPFNKAVNNIFAIGAPDNISDFTSTSGCDVFLSEQEAKDNLLVLRSDTDVEVCGGQTTVVVIGEDDDNGDE